MYSTDFPYIICYRGWKAIQSEFGIDFRQASLKVLIWGAGELH